MPAARSPAAERRRRQRIGRASRSMWSRRSKAQRMELRAKLQATWANKGTAEKEEIRARQAAGRRQRWADTPAAARIEFGKRVREGHARRRAEGREYANHTTWSRRPAAAPSTGPPRPNPVNELARRIAAEAALPGHVADIVAEVALGVVPS